MNVNLMVIPTFLLALALYWLGHRARGAVPSRKSAALLLGVGLALAAPGVLFATYYLHLFDRAQWFYEFRALRFSELSAAGVGFLAGYVEAWSRASAGGARLVFPIAALVCLLLPYSKSVLLPLDPRQLQDRWADGVCLQTTPSTCGPACVATLLRQAGVRATEREIARECYTYSSGTENWYMARALRRRGLTVRFVLSSVGSGRPPCPAIAGVSKAALGGAGHFVTVLARTPTGYLIGDPLRGPVMLSRDQIASGYLTGFFMVVEGTHTIVPWAGGLPPAPTVAPDGANCEPLPYELTLNTGGVRK